MAMTDVGDLFPTVQPLDDPGAEPGDHVQFKFRLTTSDDESDPPEDLVHRVKEIVADQKTDEDEDSSKVKVKKFKKTATEEAFPLEPRSNFWRQLLASNKKNEESSSTATVPEANPVVSYVAYNPADKGSMTLKKKELILNPKLLKTLDEKMAGDKVHVIEKRIGKHTRKKMRKAEREKTKGDAWFGMSAPEMTEETKRDLEVLKMRAAVDPKRHYKKNDSQALPKYFQIGQVVDSPVDYYSNKGTSKKKKSLVDELMADAEYQKYSKRKYAEIIDEKAKLDPRKRHKKKAKLKE